MKKFSIVWIIMALVSLIFVLPVLFLIVTAFKPQEEIIKFEHVLPVHWTLENFRQILGTPEEIPIFRWFVNSFMIASLTTVLVLIVNTLAAYGFAKLKPTGGKYVMSILIATMMIPGQVLLVGVYYVLDSLHFLNTPFALIIPAASSAFGVFLLHQFFISIPKELEEAAIIDGCGSLRILWYIVIPLARPALATLGIFVFIGSWNDFLGPLIYLDSVDKYTLPVGIALFQTSYYAEYGLTFAACVLSTLPVVLVFFIFQKQITKGISLTGLKE